MYKKHLFALTAVLFVLMASLPVIRASAAATGAEAPFKLIIDGIETIYDGSIGKFSFNGKEVNISKTPTYIFDDTAYINVKKVISRAIPDAKYSYSKSKGRIRITSGNCSIEFCLNSMITYKNGKASYSRIMPKYIVQKGRSGDYYLPGRLVFESLGYSYVWDSDNKMSKVTQTAATGRIYELYETGVVLNNKSLKNVADHHGTLCLKLPENVSKEDVTISDDLYKNEIRISIKGDHKSFFENLSFEDGCENCVLQILAEYRLEDDLTVLTIVTQTDLNGLCLVHKDEVTDSSVVITFDRAKDLYDRIIILDAGHGDSDPGTQNFGIDEKDCNLIIIKLLGRILENEGIKVFYSRHDDTLIPLRDRAYLGARLDADMFVSLHHNANNSAEKNGTSVYYSTYNLNSSLDGKVTSKIMAETMQADLIENLQTNDMNVLTTDFTVTKYNNVPAVLVELAFLSNPDECRRAITDDFRIAAAQTLAGSILKLYER